MIKKNKKNKAFSLIELLIVISIISILSAIAVPAYKTYVIKSKVAAIYAYLAGKKNVFLENMNNGNDPDALVTFCDIRITDDPNLECPEYIFYAGMAQVSGKSWWNVYAYTTQGLVPDVTGDTMVPPRAHIAYEVRQVGEELQWRCSAAAGVPTKYLPESCQIVRGSAW